MAKIEGGCLCGAVRYKSEAEPMAVVLCHCVNCQKQTGSAYSTNVMLPKDGFEVKGHMATYVDTGDSGKTLDRNFCGTCGSAISSVPSAIEGVVVLKAGTLDDTSWLKPTIEIYSDSAQEWTRVADERQCFPGMMPGRE